MMAQPAKKSKRSFQPSWEEEFFFEEINNIAVCLICDSRVTILKKSNLSDHFSFKHSNYNEKYPLDSNSRSVKVSSLKLSKAEARRNFTNYSASTKNSRTTMASLKVSWIVAQAKKPYTDVELVKKCAEILVEELADSSDKNLLNKVKSTPLSADTATRRVSLCIDDINSQLTDKIQVSKFISIAVDETTDVRDIAQCAIFIRCIDDNFDITEDLLDLVPLLNQTRGQDVFNAVFTTLKRFNVPLMNICSLTTDGAASMTGCNVGFTTLFKSSNETRNDIMTYHCIIHQENLAALRSEMFDEVMSDIVDLVKFINTNALNHRQFRQLLNEYDTVYHELVRHTNVRWLSKGKVLEHFYHLIQPIKTFLDERTSLPQSIKEIQPKLSDRKWLEISAFLADITSHLNKLNLELQGKDKLVMDLFNSVTTFQNKVFLLKTHLLAGNLIHFERLKGLQDDLGFKLKCLKDFARCLNNLEEEFKTRFADFRQNKILFTLIENPWVILPDELSVCIPEEILPQCQMELLDIQSNEVLKRVHVHESLQSFWKKVHSPNLQSVAKRVFSMFGSTYCCELTFSSLIFVKNKYRNKLTTQHTSQLIKAAVTKLEPNFSKIADSIQGQSSH